MLVKERPFPDSEGNFRVQILEEYNYNGKTFFITSEKDVPARLIDISACENGFEVSFDSSYLMELEWASRNTGAKISIYPRFKF